MKKKTATKIQVHIDGLGFKELKIPKGKETRMIRSLKAFKKEIKSGTFPYTSLSNYLITTANEVIDKAEQDLNKNSFEKEYVPFRQEAEVPKSI